MLKYSRQAFGVNAILAWIGALGSLTVDATGVVIVPQFGPTYFGGHADGLAGSIPRVVDNLSYFTIWSTILVGITTYMLYKNANRNSFWFKVLRLSSIMMISVTMLVYIYILYTFARGAVINKYPYGFINVAENGYAGALVGTGLVLVLGMFLFLVYFIIDKLISLIK